MEGLQGKVALVTGASRGIGREVAVLLAAQGARVAVNFRRQPEEAEETARRVREAGGEALLCRADLEEPAQIEEMFRQVADAWGRLDILVANAAASAFKPLLEVGLHNVRRTYAISVDAFLLCVQRSVPLMREGGRIVAVSGFDTLRFLPRHGLLASAKAAMEALVRYWAVELAPMGINVNAVCPGVVDTDSSRFYFGRMGRDWEEMAPVWRERIPKGRAATAREVAETVLFFCSPASEYVTGQILVVDGGVSLLLPPF